MKKQTITSSLLLLLAAIIWGAAFVAQSVGMEYMEPLTFNAARFLVGGFVLLPFALLDEVKQWKAIPTEKGRKSQLKTTLIGGLCCGIAICTASTFQQYGMLYTSVGKAGFITALYIVLVPIAGLFFKRKARRLVWLSVAIAVIGLYLLCINESLTVNFGDLLMFCCAIVFTSHILVIDHFSPKAKGVTLSCIQFLFSGVVSMVGMFLLEKPTWNGIIMGALPILYAGVMSCGIAYTLQILGQKHVEPAIASLILSLESVVSVLAGWVLLHEILNKREIIGCVLMFVAVVLVQLPERKKVTYENNLDYSREN